jgi:hypothetical protein
MSTPCLLGPCGRDLSASSLSVVGSAFGVVCFIVLLALVVSGLLLYELS